MNNLGLSTDPTRLSVDLPSSLTTSPSVSTFLPEEDASTCPLLPCTPSPPPMDFIHPLTPSTGNEENITESAGDDARAETSSSGSSGIGLDVPQNGPSTLFNKHTYQHLGKNGDTLMQENGGKQNGAFSVPVTKETPSFVAWNWPLIRKCTFFVFMSGLFAMCAIVVSMIVGMPKKCNPKTEWYKGNVFYEIFPASFQDSNADGLGDLRGLVSRVAYLNYLGVTAVRLNSIFPSKHYPDHFQNVTTLLEIDEVLGKSDDFDVVVKTLHAKNISLILDLPIYPIIEHLDATENSTIDDDFSVDGMIAGETFRSSDNPVMKAMRLWLDKGVDGFYVKGLENFVHDRYMSENIKAWKYELGEERVLIVSNRFFAQLDAETQRDLSPFIDLVDVFLDITNVSSNVSDQLRIHLNGPLAPGRGPWIHWTLGGVSERRIAQGLSANATLAATLMQLMLPGTPSIFYGDEISLQDAFDPLHEHNDSKHVHHLSTMVWNTAVKFTTQDALPWMPHSPSAEFRHLELIAEMISVRRESPSVYKNAVIKDGEAALNTVVRHNRNNLLIIERWFPRRNSYVSITNFGDGSVQHDLSTFFYSGEVSVSEHKGAKVYFNSFEIGPVETIIIKIDK